MINYLTYFSSQNLVESLVSILSFLNRRVSGERGTLIAIYSELNSREVKRIKDTLNDIVNVSFVEKKEFCCYEDLLKLNTDDISKYGNTILAISNKVVATKDYSYFLKKYRDAVAISKKTDRSSITNESPEIPFSVEMFFINFTDGIPSGITLEKLAIEYGKEFTLNDYFHPHPMVSLEELNINYQEYERLKYTATVVRLYSSIETRLRERSLINQEWSYLYRQISERCEVEKKLDYVVEKNGLLTIKSNGLGSKYYFLGIPFINKRLLQNGFKVYLFGIPVYKKVITELFVLSYMLGIRMSKEFNFSYIDQLLVERSQEIAHSISEANKRLVKNYKLQIEDNFKEIDADKLSEMVNELVFIKEFEKVKNNEINKEKEIRCDEF